MRYTVEDVKRVQQERECGIEQAKDILTNRELHRIVSRASSFDQLKVVLDKLIDRVYVA